MKKILVIFLIVVVSLIFHTNHTQGESKKMNDKYNSLTPQEENVIISKGTEAPFSGKFVNHKEKGTYICKRCDAPLYRSEDKFSSGCGWPSFDDEIPGAVKRVPDADGVRTEIVCNNCGAHLGHVFIGEGFTPKNTRHCVNSISMKFVTEDSKTLSEAYFAGGCFWGVEHLLQKQDGVKTVKSGYTGGQLENPTYHEVCSGNTGHYEAVKVEYDPNMVSFEKLAKLFFEIHDFTQKNGQGPDIGSQYRSAIFYVNEEQKKDVEKIINLLEGKGYEVATALLPFKKFYEAEQYHQDYYQKKGTTPYCHARRKIFE
jgi:peptide methionine sulfoxide reductase msrA/msrB